MHPVVVTAGKLELIRPRPRGVRLTELLLPTQMRTARGREQVAAVCYRIRRNKIEFLLVQTHKGRWIFPKGGIVRGLTRAQSAALEAFEEGGVHGRIEESSFAHYTSRKRGGPESDIVTHAFLCEVLRIGTPQEPNREPTWFAPEKAQLRLKERRTRDNGAELARVVDRAVIRIERFSSEKSNAAEPLRRVQFEASKTETRGLIARFAVLRTFGRKSREESHQIVEIDGGLDDARRKAVRPGSDRPTTFEPR